jgi:hypothetical protein
MLDPLRLISEPIKFFNNKSSPLTRFFEEAVSGTNWRGDGFTNIDELLGFTGDPEKRHLKGAFTKPASKRGPVGLRQFPSFMGSQARGWVPIPVQNIMSYIQGEASGFLSATKSGGLLTSEVRPKTGVDVAIDKVKADAPHYVPTKASQIELSKDKRDLLQKTKGDEDAFEKGLQELKTKTHLNPKQMKDLRQKFNDERGYRFNTLNVEDMIKVYKQLSNEEKFLYISPLRKKIKNLKEHNKAKYDQMEEQIELIQDDMERHSD